MALTRLDNLYSSKTGKYLYVSPDDFNATDELDNRGNSPLRPFKTIQRAFIEVARYSYLPGQDNDRFDQFSIMLMPGDHYIDNRPGLVDIESGDRQRYYDAKNLIDANRQEIIDRAYAEITVRYDESLWGTDWVVPGDPVDQDKNRYYDAYRLIQWNREYIQARSTAQVAIDYPDFYFPDEPQLDSASRFADAYRLILQNKQNIVDRAWDNTALAYPSIVTTQSKCKRDLGYYVEHLALDLFFGGNKWTREFILQYFDAQGNQISNGLDGEETESNYAFEAATEFMKAALTNQSSVTVNGTVYDITSWTKDLTVTADSATGSNVSPASCSNVQTTLDNLTTIVTDVFLAGNLSGLPDEDAGQPSTGKSKCFRDIGYYIDAISLDISLGGGNVYTRKYIQNYFNASGTAWIDDGLQGEEQQSIAAFNVARDLMKSAVANQLGYKDLTLTDSGDDNQAEYTSGDCANVQTTINNLALIIQTYFLQGTLENFVPEVVADTQPGESKCKRDIGYIVDAVAADLNNGGNANIVAAAKSYFDKNGLPISNGLLGEESQSVIAFSYAGVMMKKAVTNQLYRKDLTILSGPAEYAGYETDESFVPNLPSGNSATCIDVQASIDNLIGIITTVIEEGDLTSLSSVAITGDIPVFNYNRALQEWQDNSILDLSNPDNVLYKFNASSGGAIVPRGCSLIGYDLRRTIVRPLYVPDPADGTQARTSIFNLTGGCYLWQFTIKDGDLSSNSPLFDPVANVGKVYFQAGNNSTLAIPEYSHHKITIMTYADRDDLELYYDKVGRAFALFQPSIDDGDLEALPQENRIVGPLSDTRSIVKLRLAGQTASGKTIIEATTKVAHGYFREQYVAIIDNGLDEGLNGTFKITSISDTDPKVFSYEVDLTPQQLGLDINETGYSVPDLSLSARAQAEIDSVESASPYVFNCSIRSTWGQCGMWADGSKATGFKSMVVAQYTGVSLQKDDRAFIRYDEFSNTWNQASLTDAFATVAYHTKGDAYWKDDWRNFHIRASDDSFIQCVSVFAVGFFDHFLMESGGDMSITNSNSNFGNTSLHAIGFKGFSFNQDKGGYITDIVPVKKIDTSEFNLKDLKYYPLSNQATKADGNRTRLYYSGDNVYTPFSKPATSIDGYRLGARTNDKLFLKLPKLGGGTDFYEATVSPSGFKKYTASLETLTPAGIAIDNYAQDAANLIESNKAFIQNEAYLYIITKYPELQTNTNITIAKCERDIGYFVDAVVQDLRLGGNINTIQAAEGYYVGGQLAYIEQELNESIEAYDYVKNLCIAAMRNFDYLIRNCETVQGSSIINVGNTQGLLIGMKVTQYDYNTTNFTNGRLNRDAAVPTQLNPAIPAGAYIKRIINTEEIEIGNSRPSLTVDENGRVSAAFGTSVNALITTNTGTYLHFELPQTDSLTDSEDVLSGSFSSTNAVRDSEVLQDLAVWEPAGDDGYPECVNVAATIQDYFVNIFLILNNGLTSLGITETESTNQILLNKEFIANEAVARMLLNPANSEFTIPGGTQAYVDDVIEALEAYAFNIKFGGNDRVYDIARVYVTQPGAIQGQRSELVEVYTNMRTIATEVVRNETVGIAGSHGLTQILDPTPVLDEEGLDEIALTITNLTAIISQGIGTEQNPGNLQGITRTEPSFNVVDRVEPIVDTANLAARATLFTINTGSSTSDPHYFETGTPVRLVPKVRDGVDPTTVDKRVIRLPKGFSTNTIYYVIAPGRTTRPEDYSNGADYPNTFTNQSATKLMLATTKENAAAGIYMYSPETESVDENIEIELQQYVLDETFGLHQYLCNFGSGLTDVVETDVPHIFDVPLDLTGYDPVVQKVFFRTFGDPSESSLPQITVNNVTTEVNPNQYYYVRFVTPKTFAVFNTESEAVAGTPRITFAPGFGQNFYVFADKRVSPVRFDATRDDSALLPDNRETTTGQWYIQTTDAYDPAVNIQARMNEIGEDLKDARSKNTFYQRLEDERGAEDRIYRLRYVIPEYSEGVRDPLNGFVLKARTDETRKLLPQRIVLKPVAAGSASVARFEIQTQLAGGGTISQQLGLPDSELNSQFSYDPYNVNQVKIVGSERTDSKTSFSIQSARKTEIAGTEYLELTVFDLGITDDAVRNEQFVTVKINSPQGGAFRINTSTSIENNRITWNGFSSGFGYLQGYFNPDGTDEHYLVIKGLDEDVIEYNSNVATVFSQPVLDADNDPVLDGEGNQVLIYATLLAKPNSVGSPNNSLSKSDRRDYLYSDKNANVLTMTPGDIVRDDDGIQYEVSSVVDAGQIEDTFYIFDIDEIQRRIPNQQEGIYYLTCVKGNISPYPTGPGVGTNFRNFKFSQPISSLYPLDYKNDPLWFQVRADGTRDTTILDTPATICAADNFIHGLVTNNDYKGSQTKEVIFDLIENPALNRYEYVNNPITAQDGNATSGSEDRLIPISGDSPYPTERRLYVELRRPSIARSGNHTFEYLGFGPGNYSTGFPLRQEVVLEPIQDFYAQAKREDGGIVFYTGLNSNGDLYIGNRKINAITGEETFLERAELLSSDDDEGDIGGLVTTFELPVAFEQEITVDGDALFNNPVTINVDADEGNAFTVVSNVDSSLGGDLSLDSSSFNRSTIASEGNVVINQNQIFSAIYRFNPRGSNLLTGQNYSIRTHIDQGNGNTPTNKSPNQANSDLGFEVRFGTGAGSDPLSGDILLKGESVGRSGSFGWIYANYYQDVSSGFATVIALGGNLVQLNTASGISPASLGISPGSFIKIDGFTGRFLNANGIVEVIATTGSTLQFNASLIIDTSSDDNNGGTAIPSNVVISLSTSTWKELGVLGAETLRTNTDENGDYKLGINTVARAAHSDADTAFVSGATDPRANLDVVGNAWISGKRLPVGNFNNNATLAGRTFVEQDNAFLVGGDSTSPNTEAVFRVSTTSGFDEQGQPRTITGGRVGINIDQGSTFHTLSVDGDVKVTRDVFFDSNLRVDGGSLGTTNTAFNLLDGNAVTINAFSFAETLNMANTTSVDQVINIGNSTETQEVNIGRFAEEGVLNIHANPTSSIVAIGTTLNTNTNNTSVIQLGGAYLKKSNSLVDGSVLKVRSSFFEADGDAAIGAAIATGTGIARLSSPAQEVQLFNVTTSRLKFGNSVSRMSIGAQGGTTTINNTLVVKAASILEGDVTLSGGLNSGEFEVRRGSFGTDAVAHDEGSSDEPNIDLFERVEIGKTLDAEGGSFWGAPGVLEGGVSDNRYLVDPANPAGEYYLPLGQVSDVNSFEVGAYLLLDRSIEAVDANSGSTQGDAPVGEQYSELVLITELTNLNNISDLPLRIKVRRAQNQLNSDGTLIAGTPSGLPSSAQPSSYRFLRTDHPDNTVLVRYNLAENVSFIEDVNGLNAVTSGTLEDVNTGDFSGAVGDGDILRFTDTELAFITDVNTTSPQRFVVNDGNSSDPVEQFVVDSTNGNTSILGNLEVNRSITLLGSTTAGSQRLVVTNGAGTETFMVDSATGNVCLKGNFNAGGPNCDRFEVLGSSGNTTLRGGNFLITGNSLTDEKMIVQNSTGNLTLSGVVTIEGNALNTFAGDVKINGGTLTLNKFDESPDWQASTSYNNGNTVIYNNNVYQVVGNGSSGTTPPTHTTGTVVNGDISLTFLRANTEQQLFQVDRDGSMDFAGQEGFFTPNGARKWVFIGAGESEAFVDVNVNYFVAPSSDLTLKLPENPVTGDMIRIVDVGGNLTYNISLRMRAPNGILVQGDVTNANIPDLSGVDYDGGELVVQTPHAGFGLIYLGSTNYDGTATSAPSQTQGWWLVEI